MRKSVSGVFLIAMCLIAAGCGGSGSSSSSSKTKKTYTASTQPSPRSSSGSSGYSSGAPARDSGGGGANLFRLPMTNGQPVTVRAPAILFFFTTWCGYCKQALPEINRMAQRARSGGMRVYGIDVNENPSAVDGFIQQYNPSFPVLVDEQSQVARRYGVNGYPTFVVIDANNNIVFNGHDLPRGY